MSIWSVNRYVVSTINRNSYYEDSRGRQIQVSNSKYIILSPSVPKTGQEGSYVKWSNVSVLQTFHLPVGDSTLRNKHQPFPYKEIRFPVVIIVI